MKKQYVLGVDHGTGGCKVTCLNSFGELESEAYVPYPSYYPKPQYVEQDPEKWIVSAISGIRQTVKHLTTDQRKEIKAISFSAPHHVAVLLDRQYQVLRHAIMWNDQRTSKEVQYLSEKYGKRIFDITNNKPTSTWSLSHMLWLKLKEPSMYEKIHKVVFMKDFVRFSFCGEVATDYIEAEGSLLFDIHKKEWSEELCSIVSLDRSMLPNVFSPTDQSGTLLPEMANQLGIPKGIPIIIGTADTAAEVYGCGAIEEGDGIVKLATAGNFTMLSKNLPKNTNLITYDHLINGMYYLNSGTNFAAASFRWLKEGFFAELEEKVGSELVYKEIDTGIEQIRTGSEGLIFQPYLNGERSPHWDQKLRGSFFGCTTRHDRRHFARSVLEGVGYSIRDASLEFEIKQKRPLKIIGGGSKSGIWVKVIANILNCDLEVPKVSDASFGTCLIAATSIGWYTNLKEATTNTQSIVSRISPSIEDVNIYNEMFEIYKELHSQTKHLSHRLTNMQGEI